MAESDVIMPKIEGGQYAGGAKTRSEFSTILGLKSPFMIEAISWHTNRVIFEIVIPGGQRNVFFLEGNNDKGQKNAFISTPDLALYYNGSSIPVELDEILTTKTRDGLGKHSLASLKEIFLSDPDLGKPTEKLPSENKAGKKKFKDKALLSTWGSASSWYNFFASAEIARCQLDSLDFFDTCRFVQHSDIECIYVNPNMPPAHMIEMVYYPWKDYFRNLDAEQQNPLASALKKENHNDPPEEASGSQLYMTDFNEYDVIMGSSIDKLDAALKEATSKPHNSFILCSCTCVPIVAGEDSESVVKRYQAKSKSPLLFLTCTAQSMENLFYNLLVKSRKKPEANRTEKERNNFNLVGFPANNAVRELTACLQETGMKLNTCIFPHLDLETVVEKYPKAALNVIYPNMLWQHLYDQLLLDSEIKTIFPPSPYGIKRSREWLSAVAAEGSGPSDFDGKWAEYHDSHIERINNLRKQCAGYSLCFIIDGEETFRLIEESHTWGVPLLPLVEEMGFKIHVYIYASDRTSAYESAKAVSDRLSEPEKHVIKAFNTPERLNKLLEEENIHAVYSDYFFDWRLTENGKSQFSLQVFEMGLQGMARTMERLLRICKLNFFSRYQKYFKKYHMQNPNQNFLHSRQKNT